MSEELGPFEPGAPDAAEQIVARWIYRERETGEVGRLDNAALGAMVRSLLPPGHAAQRPEPDADRFTDAGERGPFALLHVSVGGYELLTPERTRAVRERGDSVGIMALQSALEFTDAELGAWARQLVQNALVPGRPARGDRDQT